MEKGEFLYQRPDGGLSKVTPGKTSLKFVQTHEQVAGLYRPRLRKVLSAAVQAMALSVLLAGGTIYTIQHQNPQFTRPSALVEMPAAVISAARLGLHWASGAKLSSFMPSPAKLSMRRVSAPRRMPPP